MTINNSNIKNKKISILNIVKNSISTTVNILDNNFRQALIDGAGKDSSGNVITFDDNNILQTEIDKITKLNLDDKNIDDLTGIELFTALEELDCSENNLSSLDVSANIALKELDCSENSLSSLDISKNITLEELECRDNKLSSLDISANIALEELDCSRNSLSSLDVSANVALEELDCSRNSLSSLDLSANIALEELDCSRNSLSSLDVNANIVLKKLECRYTNLSSLDVSANIALEDLDCSRNSLSSLVVNTAIVDLNCSENKLSSLDVSTNILLEELNCSYNSLSSLDLSNNYLIEEIDFSNNFLKFVVVNNDQFKKIESNSWIILEKDTNVQFLDKSLLNNEIYVLVKPGWNLISGLNYVNSVLDENNMIIEDTLYNFDNIYHKVSYMEPSRGYWVKSSGEGQIKVIPRNNIPKILLSANKMDNWTIKFFEGSNEEGNFSSWDGVIEFRGSDGTLLQLSEFDSKFKYILLNNSITWSINYTFNESDIGFVINNGGTYGDKDGNNIEGETGSITIPKVTHIISYSENEIDDWTIKFFDGYNEEFGSWNGVIEFIGSDGSIQQLSDFDFTSKYVLLNNSITWTINYTFNESDIGFIINNGETYGDKDGNNLDGETGSITIPKVE